MKRKMNLLFNITSVVLIATSIIVLPSALFKFQKSQLLNIRMEVPIEAIKITKNKTNLLDLNKRMEMIQADNTNIEKLTLKTGDKYSLYEARKQCFKELLKLSMLEIDLYGPSNKEIKIYPYLIIDSVTPAYSFIIWSGSLVINNVSYNIILDEDSGKLLEIKVSEHNQLNTNQNLTNLQNKLDEEWNKYILKNE